MKHINVSVFVPHAGCPHQCSFCNQRSISGAKSQPTAQDVRDAALVAMRSSPEGIKDGEIAFFGGSFTAIDRDYMIELLSRRRNSSAKTASRASEYPPARTLLTARYAISSKNITLRRSNSAHRARMIKCSR